MKPHSPDWRAPQHDVLELCARAGALLKEAGFVVGTVSMKSEAVYYRLPDRPGLLRVSAHASRKSPIGMEKVVATLTFRGHRRTGGRFMVCSPAAIDQMIWVAIGQYMLRGPAPSRYLGKRGTWEAEQQPSAESA